MTQFEVISPLLPELSSALNDAVVHHLVLGIEDLSPQRSQRSTEWVISANLCVLCGVSFFEAATRLAQKIPIQIAFSAQGFEHQPGARLNGIPTRLDFAQGSGFNLFNMDDFKRCQVEAVHPSALL